MVDLGEMAHLVVREPGRVTMTVALHSGFAVGREAGNDLVLTDRHASRRHATFTIEGTAYRIADAGSTHGIYVNREPATERLLADGDVIQIGNVLMVYREADLPADVAVMSGSGPEVTLAGGSPEARRLRLLYDLGRALGEPTRPDELMTRMLDAALDELRCERGMIGVSEPGASAGRRLIRGRGAVEPDDIVVSRTLLERVLGRGESVLVDVGSPGTPITVVREGVKSAMAAPLKGARGILGFIYVDDRARHDRFALPELDFLTTLARLAATAVEQVEEQRRSSAVAEALRDANPIPEILGSSEPMRRLRAVVQKYAAAAPSAILVRGESGTGKELVATTIHALSPRAAQPFVTVNCAAIPDTLIESELFGHEKGAFTGAVKARRGKFVLADKGTIFLDEVGDLTLAAQAKLLRAIEEGEIQPVGSEKTIQVDVRVISATHKPLADEIAAKRFREDLYYRLSVGEIEVPPLRARGEDVILLARTVLARAAARLGKPVRDFHPGALEALRRYGWPGNVRQLQNEIERAVILAEGPAIELAELGARVVPGSVTTAPTLAERFTQLDAVERELVVEALARAEGNVSEAARLLGVSRIMLRRRVERYGLAQGD